MYVLKDLLKAQEEIEKKEFTAENGFVKVTLNGKKEVLDIKITPDEGFEIEDIEVLQDMIMIAINDAIKQIKKEEEAKLGKFTGGMPGLF